MAVIRGTSDLTALKTKIKALEPMKQTLTSLHCRTLHHMVNRLPEISTPVYDCISDMIKYVDIMIDNADLYEGWIGGTYRHTSAGGKAFATEDVTKMEKTVKKCIEIIDNHNSLK